MIPDADALGLSPSGARQPRSTVAGSAAAHSTRDEQELRNYWDTLAAVAGDLVITDDELAEILALRQQLQLSDEQVRAVHGRLFGAILNDYSQDRWIDEGEAEKLARLYECLAKLGWAPGARPASSE